MPSVRPVRRLFLALAVTGATLATWSCGGAPPPRPGAPIVLISIDTLRADRLPAYGYARGETPAIDALAADGVVVERAYSTYPLTLPAHATMLSGLLPPNHGVRDNSGFRFDAAAHPCFPKTLAERGYATGAFVSAWVLRGATGLGDCFEVYDDDTGPPAGNGEQRPGSATLARAAAWLEKLPGRPFFLFLHLFEPHAPYAPPQPFASALADPYNGEIAAADAVVGELVALLRRLGRYDDALIALVSDHGEGLGDHGELRHGALLYQEAIRVPWIVKLPGTSWRGRKIAEPVSLVDLAPTLLGAVGVPRDAAFDGSSILDARRDADRDPIYAETWYPRLRLGWSELVALVDRRYSTIVGTGSGQTELYDLTEDPKERENLAESMRPLVARRSEQLRALGRAPDAPAAADAETLAKLAALGYLGGPGVGRAPTPTAGGAALPNPRDRVQELTRLEEALAADAAGDPARAARELERLLADNPEMVEALPFLARVQIHLGRIDDAVATLRRALARDAHPSVTLQLAEALLQKGDFDEAAKLAESVLPDDPRRGYAALQRIARQKGDRAAIARWSEAAIAAGVAGPVVVRERARRLAAAGHPEQAVALLEPRAEGADPEMLALLAVALADSGRAEDALALLERARRRDPRNPTLLESLGAVALRLERTAVALEALEAAVQAAPERASTWNALGVARFRAGSPADAVEAWKRAVALDATLAEALYNLGLVAARLGDRDAARDALARYLAIAADAPPADRAQARRLLVELGG
jgi:arylsulfatase A-like enzyme/predicted Zn-dependent protease